MNYKEIAVEELLNRKLESTISCYKYLKLDKVFTTEDAEYVYQLGKTEFVAVSFPVLNGKVYVIVYINIEKNKVDEVVVEPGSYVSLVSTSKTYSINELQGLTGLISVNGWSIGDKKGKREMDFTSFRITPNENSSEYYSDKLIILLDYLEDNRDSILELIKISDKCLIKVVSWCFYKQVNGILLPHDVISKIANFNLSLDFEPFLVEQFPAI